MPTIPPALEALYQERCNEEGLPFSYFIDEVIEAWPASALLALLEVVEQSSLENMRMLVDAHPELEATAEQRAQSLRAEFEALRAQLEARD